MQAICAHCGCRFTLDAGSIACAVANDIPTFCSEDCEQMFFRGPPEWEPQPEDCMEDISHEVSGGINEIGK